MAQSRREDVVVSIDPSHTRGPADSSRSSAVADARAVLCATNLARCLPSLRHQIAVTRTLLDELEGTVPSSLMGTSEQLIEELIRLGARVLDAAAVLAEHHDGDREQQLRA